MEIKLIDVSKHNGSIDFAKVKKSGIEGVIIRAGLGFQTVDTCFKTNIQNAIKNGLHIGIYWFGYAGTVAHAKKEAEYCAKLLESYKGKIDLPIFYDWEYDSYDYVKKQYGITATKHLVSDMTKAFCEVLEGYGWYSGFYANIDYLNNFYNQTTKDRFCCWVAQWSSKCTYTGNYIIWQYSETGKVNGISGNTDLDYLCTNIYDTITSKGFNGYSKTSTIDTSKYNYDVNGDGVIDEKDLIALQEYLKSKGEI